MRSFSQESRDPDQGILGMRSIRVPAEERHWIDPHRRLHAGPRWVRTRGLIREHPRFQANRHHLRIRGDDDHGDQLRGYALGAFDYVPVPVVPELLRAKVKVFWTCIARPGNERLNAELEERVSKRSATLRRLNERLEQRIGGAHARAERALAQLYEAKKMIPSAN